MMSLPEACANPQNLLKILFVFLAYSCIEYRLGRTKFGSTLGLVVVSFIIVVTLVIEKWRKKNG